MGMGMFGKAKQNKKAAACRNESPVSPDYVLRTSSSDITSSLDNEMEGRRR